ncbi:MAG: hypothetical protein WCQ97_10280 [Aminobacterium sp.]
MTGYHEWGDVARESCVIEYYQQYREPFECRSPSNSCGVTSYDGTSSFSINCTISNTCNTLCGKAIVTAIGCY